MGKVMMIFTLLCYNPLMIFYYPVRKIKLPKFATHLRQQMETQLPIIQIVTQLLALIHFWKCQIPIVPQNLRKATL